MGFDAGFFDGDAEYSVLHRRLDHWQQAGTFAFVTFRLRDSMPPQVVVDWQTERARLVREAGGDPSLGLADALASLPKRAASLLRWKIFQAWDRSLDDAYGECLLRDRRASQIVADGLLKFEGDRYAIASAAVMPNHVHLLAAFADEGGLTSQGSQWRKCMARQINPLFKRSGHLWQQDQFDHLVRSPQSFERIRQYIMDNPQKAGLKAGEYRLYVSPDW